MASGKGALDSDGYVAVMVNGQICHVGDVVKTTECYFSGDGGTIQASSERDWGRGAGQGDVTTAFCCSAKVTVNGSQAIEGRWRTSASTATMHERSLVILKVA